MLNNEIINTDGDIFKISEQGIHFGNTLIPIYNVYEYMEINTYIELFSKDSTVISNIINTLLRDLLVCDVEKSPILIAEVGNGEYYVPILKKDVVGKKSITIYTVNYNIGNVIGTSGCNIKNTLFKIQKLVDGCKLTHINVREIKNE